LGQSISAEDLESYGTNKQTHLDSIKTACQDYFKGPLKSDLPDIVAKTMQTCGINNTDVRIELDPSDNDQQSLLFKYPTVVAVDGYITGSIKIEGGAKSALDPNQPGMLPWRKTASGTRNCFSADRPTILMPPRTVHSPLS